MDEGRDAKKMFAVPNRFWARDMAQSDIWGIDGFDAPEVTEKPTSGSPYQVVKYRGIIYVADEDGRYSPQIDVKPLNPHDKKYITEYEGETGKQALKDGTVTKNYFNWLNERKKPDIKRHIADELTIKDRDWSEKGVDLIKIKELYENLDVSKEDLKKIFIHMANNHYAGPETENFTKKVAKFHDHIYQNTLDDMIKRARKGTPTLEQIQAGERAYIKQAKQGTGLPVRNVRNILERKGYGHISEAVIVDALRSGDYRSGKTDFAYDIATDVIAEFKRGEQVDTDIVEIKEFERAMEKEQAKMKGYYERRAIEDYIDHLYDQGYSEKEVKKHLKKYGETGAIV